MSAGGIVLPPYAQSMGFRVDRIEAGVPVLACDGNERIVGMPGNWHGGALSGLLEMAAIAAVQASPEARGKRLKPVNVNIQFLRGGRMQPTYAAGTIVRLGRRLVNVSAEVWQDDRARPLARAQLHVLLADA